MSGSNKPFPSGGYTRKKVVAARILVKSVIYAFAIFGVLFILLLFAALGLLRSDVSAPEVPDKAVVLIDLDDVYSELNQDNLLTEISEGVSMSFSNLLIAIETAAYDDRIKALAAKINVSNLGMAQAQELYQAVKDFRKNGKETYIYSTGFGVYGGGTKEFYLATAFDKISMQPNTEVGLTGISAEVPFLRELLDKIGITPEFFSRYEYKNAMASFLDKKISSLYKDSLTSLINCLNKEFLGVVAENRFQNSDWGQILQLVGQAPFSAEYAKEKGLIDEVAYEGEWRNGLEKKYDAEFVDIIDYAAGISVNRSKPKVAVLTMEGTISEGPSLEHSLQGDSVIGSETVLKQIKEIEQDEGVKAVVVRINSPGGSYTAANEIWYALSRLKTERQLPLVVSMGNYAASGGYFIALPGDKIFADSATVTGSIGVLGGKMVFADLWDKLGVRWSNISLSDTAASVSPNFKFTKKQKDIFNKSLDRIYKDFTLKVSEARKIDLKTLDKLARGRIWLGMEARDKGLVDELGGLSSAIAEAKHLAGIGKDDSFGLSFYPKPKSLQEKINDFLKAAPLLSAAGIGKQLGIDTEKLSILKRLQYDAVLPPINFND